MPSEESKPNSVPPAVERLRALTDKYAWGPHREAHATALVELVEQLETQMELIRDLASELASVSDIAAAPDGDYERWLRGLLARADAAVTRGSGEPGV